MTFLTEPEKKFLFIISYTKLNFQELFLNALKCSLHLVLNVLLGWPSYFIEQSGNFFWCTQFFDFFICLFSKNYPQIACFKSDVPIPVAARSKVWVCDRSLAGIAGSNPTDDIDVCLLWVLFIVR